MNILDKIVARKREELIERKQQVSESTLIDSVYFNRPIYRMSTSILAGSGIISEFKKKSPSKPDIKIEADVKMVVPAYANAGASGISILTDKDFFGGSDEDILAVREMVNTPILRKDFIIDPYQILEARAMGADCILLIAEILEKDEIMTLAKFAKDLDLDIIMEIHTADQILKCNDYIPIVGVNNRNLKTFVTDIHYSIDIFPKLPNHVVKISESGIHASSQAIALKAVGYDGFLIGENFMKTNDPGQALSKFIVEMNNLST